jgi:predicted NBD/HSP70 family sugar kinase
MGASGNLPRGRKPKFLHLNSERAGIIGVDIRSGSTAMMLADLEMRTLAQDSLPTVKNPEQFVSELASRIRAMMQAHPHLTFEGIGIALPGRIDYQSNRLIFAPNLAWKSFDLKTPLEAATGLGVELENAANTCALAEIWGGTHSENVHNLVAVTVSEGIGTGMVLNGQLVRGFSGLAGEFGHVTVQENGPLCNCGNRGCWESCASNAAAVRYFIESEPVRTSQSVSGRPTFDLILKLAEQGNPQAIDALKKMAYHLGTGLAMTIAGLAPEVVVIIGEVTRAWDRVGPIVDEVIAKRLFMGAKTRIIPTNPDAQPRLRGTIALVLQKHFGVPHLA